MKEVNMSFPIKLFLVLLLSPLCWCQQPPTNLKARTLFYRESPDNDQLPPASASKPRKAKKIETSKSTAANTDAPSGSGVSGSNNGTGAVANLEGTGDSESGGSGSSKIPAVQNLGLRYNLLLVDRSSNSIIESVSPARNFHEGECVALEFEPNRSGYLYVLEKGSSGAWKPLFPSPQLPDESNIVRARTPVRVPESNCFTIHPPKGEERVFVILSRNPADVYELQESLRRENGGTTSPLLAQNISQLKSEMEKRLASRDLDIDTVAQPQAAGERPYSVYVANASKVAFDELSVQIQIKHN
jgi:hypothetical protein